MVWRLSAMESEALWQRFPSLSMYIIAKWAYSGSSGDRLDIFFSGGLAQVSQGHWSHKREVNTL